MQNTLRVLSLNIWGLGYNIATDRAERVQAIGQALDTLNLDIVGFQEVWVKRDQIALMRAGANAGLHYARYFRAGLVGSGLLILSRYPILSTDFHLFSLRAWPERFLEGDYYAGKGVSLARIQTPYGELDFYNTHAIAQYEADAIDPYALHRAGNMVEIATFINRSTTSNPVIVTGDFNVNPYKPGYHLVRALARLEDTFASLHPHEQGVTFSHHNPYAKGHSESERLDYVMIREGQKAGLQALSAEITLTEQPTPPHKPYSDHYGVLAEIAWQPTPRLAIPVHDPAHHPADIVNRLPHTLSLAIGRRQSHFLRAVIGLVIGLLIFRNTGAKWKFFGLSAWLYAGVQSWLAGGAVHSEIAALHNLGRHLQEAQQTIKDAVSEILD